MSEISPLEIAHNFKLNVMKLIDFLIDILDSDSDLLAARLVVKMIPDKIAIENFAHNAETHRNEIESSNESYFLDEDGGQHSLFSDFSESKVIKFKTFWKQLSHDQHESIWKYFKYFLRLSDRYVDLINRNK